MNLPARVTLDRWIAGKAGEQAHKCGAYQGGSVPLATGVRGGPLPSIVRDQRVEAQPLTPLPPLPFSGRGGVPFRRY